MLSPAWFTQPISGQLGLHKYPVSTSTKNEKETREEPMKLKEDSAITALDSCLMVCSCRGHQENLCTKKVSVRKAGE